MTVSIYHQLGHNDIWNFLSLSQDLVGDGVVLSPKFMTESDISSRLTRFPTQTIFDPQFFLPTDAVKNLKTYPFFPKNVLDRKGESASIKNSANEIAEGCVQFQISHDFTYLVIPTSASRLNSEEDIDSQQQEYVQPFLEAIINSGTDKPVLLEVVLSDYSIKNETLRNRLLNWITGLRGIDGVYLILELQEREKVIQNIDLIVEYCSLIDILKSNDLYVLLGYLNLEGIVLSIANPDAITVGSYENLRMFNPVNFIEGRKGPPHSPKPRIYSSLLLNWIESTYIPVLVKTFNHKVLDESPYNMKIFTPNRDWQFTQPEVYKHFFYGYSNQLKQIYKNSGKDRYELLGLLFNDAQEAFKKIGESGIVLDYENSGRHIAKWHTAINLFAKRKGWI